MPLITTDDLAKYTRSRMGRAKLSKCPGCGSFDVERMSGGDHAGPTDRCARCHRTWAHRPGTLTAAQMHESAEPTTLLSRFARSLNS